MASPFDLLNPYHLAGMSPAAVRADGAGLPSSSATSLDKADTPFHPDSAVFWLAAVIVLTAAGIAGASVRVHAGPARAGASIGKE